jgi:c-di-GMP-related signal transduction protein
VVKRLGPRCRVLAEKIETQADFARARDLGFVYFQGYFFRRPETLNTTDLRATRCITCECCRKYRVRNWICTASSG